MGKNDLSCSSVMDYLLPIIQNLLKDTDTLDPVHKEALKIIFKERSGGTFDAISKVMGAHLVLASSVSRFFSGSGLLGKRKTGDLGHPAIEVLKIIPQPPIPTEDKRFRWITRGGFTEMLKRRAKCNEEGYPTE